MTDKPKVDLGLLEEDDEFEEFPAEGKNQYSFIMCVRIGTELVRS
jgi:hypothetical protein